LKGETRGELASGFPHTAITAVAASSKTLSRLLLVATHATANDSISCWGLLISAPFLFPITTTAHRRQQRAIIIQALLLLLLVLADLASSPPRWLASLEGDEAAAYRYQKNKSTGR
jgi:hypothetical protein